MSTEYLLSVDNVDEMLSQLFHLIETNPAYVDKTTIILTTDHGSIDGDHGNQMNSENYTIPFPIWGSQVAAGADLYNLNPTTRLNPGTSRPNYTGLQPIRNGDAGNLALSLLGLQAIPGSAINADQTLVIAAVPLPAALWLALPLLACLAIFVHNRST